MNHILKCVECNSYGMKEQCECGGKRVKPKPPKYSHEDKYAEYRRKYKEGSRYDENPAEDADMDADSDVDMEADEDC